jgi:hypothetical protein
MKSAVLIATMLSGLCAGALASPLSRSINDSLTDAPGFVDNALPSSVIEPDLSFNAFSILEVFTNDEIPGATTDVPIGDSQAVDLNKLDLNLTSDTLRGPEPPPLVPIGLGLCCIGALGLVRHNRNAKRLTGRRTHGARAATAAR